MGSNNEISKQQINEIKKKITEYPDMDRINFLTNRPWWNSDHTKINEYLKTLIPGTQLVANPSDKEEVQKFIESMKNVTIKIADNKNIKLQRMDNSQCHQNSFMLLLNKNIKQMNSGYALSADGLWRHHSWCIDMNNNIIETTIKRLIYVSSNVIDKEKIFKQMGIMK